METTIVQLTVRLPADVHAALTATAERDERSLNSQMVYLLRQTLACPKPAAKK